MPSRSAETFGLAAAEAMAAGVPVVASAVGALPELVDPDGSWRRATSRRSPRAARARFGDEQAGAAGLRRIRELASPDAVAARLRALY